MKSLKQKIAKKTKKVVRYKKPTTSQIQAAIAKLDSGQIKFDLYGGLKESLAWKGKLKSQNPVGLHQKGEYEVLERIEVPNDNIASRLLKRKFGRPEDYVELHIYNNLGHLLFSNPAFTDYKLPDLSTEEGGLTKEINIEPVEVLNSLGYNSGEYKLVLNIQRLKIFNTAEKLFSIKEISPSRRELKIIANNINNISLEQEILSYIGNIESSGIFRDFVLNFGDNLNELGVNIALDRSNDKQYEILIKLYEPLDSELSIGASFKIAEEITDPIMLTVDLGELDPIESSIPLRGPNFRIDTRLNNSVPSNFKNYDEILEYSLTSSYQHLLNKLENSDIPEIQYDYIREVHSSSIDPIYHFENFVHFSSAKERINNFTYKIKLLELYDAQIESINTISGSTSESIAVKENKDIIDVKKVNLLKGFDGYENFLYFTSGTFAWPKTNTSPPYTLYATTSSEAKTWVGSDQGDDLYYGG